MINKRRKKKGASLLVVVAMMAILSVLIVSLLAMTTSGYKLRVDSNNRVEGFYGADSGLEISEKVLQDYLKANIETSNKAVSSSLDVDEKNKEFKKSFNKFIIEGGKSTKLPLYDNPTLISGEYEYKPLIEEIAINEYYKKFDRKDVSTENVKLYYTTDINKSNYQELIYPVTLSEETMALIKGFRLELESEYKKNSKTRRVAVKFNIDIPDYGKAISKADSSSPDIFDYIFAVDGNYELRAGGTVSVLGDIWVKGRETKSDNLIENKYKNGIVLKSGSDIYKNPNITWDGNIATASNLEVSDVNLNIGTNGTGAHKIFAKNLVVNTENNSNLFGNSLDVYLYNDFVYNSKSSKLNMKNLYAINDINNYQNNVTTGDKLDESERSSSMIINSNDFGQGSNINIGNDMYVLGSSYLDLTKPYQTGQSVVINGISSPYTVRYDDYIYNYDEKGKVHIIDTDQQGNELDIFKKADLVLKKRLTDKENTFSNGIQALNIYNTAAVLAKGNVIGPNKNINMDIVKEKQKEYVTEVFNMGNDKNVSSDDFEKKEVKASVEDSFDWFGMAKMIKGYGKCRDCPNYDATGNCKQQDTHCKTCDTCKLTFNNTMKIKKDGFLHLQSKVTIKDIIAESEKNPDENSELGKEPGLSGPTDLRDQKINLILNATDKKLKIEQVNNGHSKAGDIEDDGSTITYYFENSPFGLLINPVLIISKGDVEFKTETHNNYSMILTAGDTVVSTPAVGTHIGNYSVPSSKGLINELFKYSLGSNGILSGIGGSIFGSTENIEVKEAIEISDLIEREKWQLIK